MPDMTISVGGQPGGEGGARQRRCRPRDCCMSSFAAYRRAPAARALLPDSTYSRAALLLEVEKDRIHLDVRRRTEQR
jgi:hypothetical protein